MWLDLLTTYLPRRYDAASAHVVDSEGTFSDQIDVVIFDRQYSPLIFHFEGQKIIPSESIYATFEAKQTLNAQLVQYAREKCKTVRDLVRTSLPIPHAGGTYDAKKPSPILSGILTFESDWSPPLGNSLNTALTNDPALPRLDIGCVAAHGIFYQTDGNYPPVVPRLSSSEGQHVRQRGATMQSCDWRIKLPHRQI